MSRLDFHLGQSEITGVSLNKAILLYKAVFAGHHSDSAVSHDPKAGAALATVHDIHQEAGKPPVILPGRAVSTLAVARLARDLSRRDAGGGFVPPHLLYQDLQHFAWWEPPAWRTLWFRCPELGDGERSARLPQPGLVFCVSQAAGHPDWRVWAVKGASRPDAQTPLYQAPYFNVYASGRICAGNVPTPKEGGAGHAFERIEAWNKAFWDSYFTHPNAAGQLVNFSGGAFAFWRAMLEGRFKRFPPSALRPMNRTLADQFNASLTE